MIIIRAARLDSHCYDILWVKIQVIRYGSIIHYTILITLLYELGCWNDIIIYIGSKLMYQDSCQLNTVCHSSCHNTAVMHQLITQSIGCTLPTNKTLLLSCSIVWVLGVLQKNPPRTQVGKEIAFCTEGGIVTLTCELHQRRYSPEWCHRTLYPDEIVSNLYQGHICIRCLDT